jgi:hypothetical protein
MIRGYVDFKGLVDPDPNISKAQFYKAVRHGTMKAGEWMAKVLVPRHFTPQAQARYGYKERDVIYNKRKLRKKGHKTALVWSGGSRTLAERTARVTSWTKTRAVTTFTMSKQLMYRTPRGMSRPNLKKEVQSLVNADCQEAAQVYVDETVKEMARIAASNGRRKEI